MKKKLLTIVLAAVMCMGLVLGATLTANAADEVTTLADLQTAINAGGTVKLGAAIDLGNTNLTFPDNTPVTIDLNGKILSKSQSGYVMTIEAADTVTITDSVGTGSVEKGGGWYFFYNSGNLKIGGGTYNKSGYDLVYTNDSSVTEITGGVFVLENIIARQSDSSTATISNGNFTVSTVSTGIWDSGITITGGTFSIDPTTYGVNTQNYTVTKNADNTYTVGETPATYTVTATASPTAGGSVTGGNTYEENASVTVTATANDGYKFVKWTENGSDVSTDASYTFTAAADRTLVAVFKQIEYVKVNLKSPSGLDTEITIDIEATVADLKDAVAAKANVTFGDNSVYRLFGEDIGYPNSRLDDDTKILGDIGFANGQTIHLEKDDTAPWDTSEAPIKIFGLTITGGTGAQEPYGAYSNADYQWNYAYKTITLTGCASGTNVTISGTAEEGTHIIVRSNTWRYLTLDGVSMSADYPCITVNASAKLDLTIKGTNTLVSSSRTEYGNTYKFPAISLNQSKSQLRINDGGGTLTATSTCDGMPGIGTTGDDQSVGKFTIYGGTVTANGGKGAPGVRTSSLYMSGGKLTANGGTDSTSDIYIYGTDTKSIQIIKGDGPVIVADTVVANVNGYVNINEGTNIKKLTAPDVYFNVDTNTEVTGNAWYPITDNASSSNGSLAYTAGITDSMNRPTIYGKAGDTVSFTVSPASGQEVSSVTANDSAITASEGVYSFTMPKKSTAVKVTFAPTTCTVTFDANGGTCDTASATTSAGKLASLPEAAREGYVFNGWYTAQTGGDKITTDTAFSANTTVYAQWLKEGTFTVVYKTNAEVEMGRVTYTVGDEVNAFPATNQFGTLFGDFLTRAKQKGSVYVAPESSRWFTDAAFTDPATFPNLGDGETYTVYCKLTTNLAISTELTNTANDVPYSNVYGSLPTGLWVASYGGPDGRTDTGTNLPYLVFEKQNADNTWSDVTLSNTDASGYTWPNAGFFTGVADNGTYRLKYMGYTAKDADGVALFHDYATDPTNGTYTVKINPVELTITGVTAADRAAFASTDVILGGGTLVGVLAQDAGKVSFDLGVGTAQSTEVGTQSVTTSITLTGEKAANYTLTQPTDVTVNIKEYVPYTVTVISGTADKTKYGEGEIVTITADYPRTGTAFNKWTTDDGVTFADSTSQETTFIMPAKDVSVTATYETAYDIRIGDNAVTNGNKDDVLGDGTVKYDPETNTLTLSDADIESIESGIQNITVKLEGENTVSGYITLGSSSDGCVTITSVDKSNKGSLTASDINAPGGYYLNIMFDSVSYTGGLSNSNVGLKDTLTIKNSDVTTEFMMWMSGTTYQEVGYGGIILENSTLTASEYLWTERLTIDDNSVFNMNTVLKNYGNISLANALSGIVDHLPDGYSIAYCDGYNTVVDADGELASNIAITRRYTVTVENGTGGGRYAKGETVTVKANDPASGKTFKAWTANSGVTFANSTSRETTFTMPASDVTVTATYKTQSSSNSAETSTYSVTVKDTEGGETVASHNKAKSGVTVTVTATADDGYAIDTVTVTDKNGNEIKVTDKGDGKYTFTMPSSKVTVTVNFKSTSDGKHICPSEEFDDLDTSAWYHAATDYVLANELMKGMGSKIFAPDISTSRAMIATILWRIEGSPIVNYVMTFEDVEEDAWYTEAVRWAASEDVVFGYSEKVFAPDDAITREQLAAMLYRYIQYKGGGFTGAWMFLLDYTDRADVSDWAYEAVCYTTMHGIVKGKNNNIFDPKGNATRAEVAQLFMNYLEQ